MRPGQPMPPPVPPQRPMPPPQWPPPQWPPTPPAPVPAPIPTPAPNRPRGWWRRNFWGLLVIPGLCFGYFTYKRRLPPRVSSALQPLLGEGIHGPWGRAVAWHGLRDGVVRVWAMPEGKAVATFDK